VNKVKQALKDYERGRITKKEFDKIFRFQQWIRRLRGRTRKDSQRTR